MYSKQDVIDYLSKFMLEERYEKIRSVVNNRSNHIAVVLEDLYQSHNMAAAVRTCECFGFPNICVIEKSTPFFPHKQIVKGSIKWVNLKQYEPKKNNTKQCLSDLKEQGYKIAVTSPAFESDHTIYDLPVDQKIAVVFGNERKGVTKQAQEIADYKVTIPMYGFTESFNISVSVGIVLNEITKRLRASDIEWQLSEKEKEDLMYKWVKKSVRAASTLEKKFLTENHN